MIHLETPRLVLRDYTPADREEYICLKTHQKTMYYLQNIMLHSQEEGEEDFARVLADAQGPERTFYFLRAELKDGTQIGSTGYTVIGRTPLGKICHAGYFYLPPFWGRGYGSEAFQAVLDFAFQQDNVYRMNTGCLEENRGSERIMQKCGMIQEAHRPDWEWHDGQMKSRVEYRLLRGEYEAKRGILKGSLCSSGTRPATDRTGR